MGLDFWRGVDRIRSVGRAVLCAQARGGEGHACGGGLAAPLPRLPVKAAPHHPFHPAPARPPPTTQTIYANVLLPGAAAQSLMVLGQTGMSIAMLAVAAIACYLFFRWRDQIALAARLLGVSAHSLAQNPHLVSTTVLLSLAR